MEDFALRDYVIRSTLRTVRDLLRAASMEQKQEPKSEQYANYVLVDQVLFFMRRVGWTMKDEDDNDVTREMGLFLAGMVWALRYESLEASRQRVREELETCQVRIVCNKYRITEYASDWFTEYVRRALQMHDEIRAELTEDTEDMTLRSVLRDRMELPSH